MRNLRVKGLGEVSKNPDLIVIQFKIKVDNYDYDDAINELNYRTETLKNDIMKIGFSRDDLKTTNFRIETKYKYSDNHQTIFLGYQAIHDLKLEFDYNRNVLNNLIRILSTSKANAEFRIFFEVKDKETFKNEVLQDAVLDAIDKAKVIASTAGIKLGKIIKIDYDIPSIIYRANLSLDNMMLSEKATNIDVVPEDVKGTDQVVMEYEIEDYI